MVIYNSQCGGKNEKAGSELADFLMRATASLENRNPGPDPGSISLNDVGSLRPAYLFFFADNQPAKMVEEAGFEPHSLRECL